MNLDTLSAEYGRATGKTVGFVIKSLAHPERKFKVEAKLTSGQYGITRLDTGKSYLVLGTEDRYSFVIPMTRVTEVKAEIVELSEQATTIAERLTTLKAELGDFLGTDEVAVG